ncbi:ankyrin, partial [Corynespora cassiicola Philippines]
MKSIPCIPLSQAHDSSADSDIDSYKDGPRPAALGPRGPRGPKIQTMIEVLRCGLARPARSTTTPLDGASLQPSKGWTPIYHAVYHNREAALLHFLRVGHSPDDVAKTGQPPLCIAVAMGYMSMVKILCEAGADVQAKTSPDEETALHLAIKTGRTDIMEILLAYRPDLEAQTLPTGETPLHYAAGRSNSLSAVVALLKRGANYEARDSQGRTPAELALNIPNLHAAVAIITKAHGKRNRLSKEKEMLLKHVEKPQSRYSMNNELIADIFKAGCDPDSSVLVEAIKRGEVNLVDMFLERGADPNRKTVSGVRPIFAAIDCPSAQQIVGLLNKHKADVMGRNADGLTVLQAVLQRASKLGKDATAAMFESLLSNGADPKVTYIDGKTLLHHAASSTLNLEKVAAQLLEHGVKVDARDNQGNTALHLATGRSCIELLLKNGAGVNLVNNKRLTPLLRAITMVSKQLEGNLEGLVKASETRKADSEGKTALHLAAENGLDKTVKWLLRSRAETTMVDSKGRTPLLLAVLNQQWSTVPLLAIQPGINTWDEAGMTALHHIAMSIPKEPATWKDIASAASAFCERGVSRSMRDRSGATPLIQAIKNLPEEGLAVVDVLLAQSGQRRGNCVGHQDHKRQDALHYAATLGKPEFVYALLKAGAPFELQDWIPGKGRLELTSSTDKHTLKLLAERDWLRQVEEAPLEPILPKVLPLDDLAELLRMGLAPSALPRSKPTNSLLWVVLNQTAIQPTLPADYLHDSIKLLLANNQDPNALTTRQLQALRPLRGKTPSPTPTPEPLTMHPITYLLEKHPTVDMDTLTLLL